jgi:hypothetical protein
VAWFGVWFGVKFNKQGFGAVLSAKVWCPVWCPVWVPCGAKQTSKSLARCRVLSKDKVQGLGVLCGCCVGAVAVLNKQARVWLGAWCRVGAKQG